MTERLCGLSIRGLAWVGVIAGLAACGTKADGLAGPGGNGSLAACPQGTAMFTVSPVALADFYGWVPLGALNPPGHTLPTDHQYVYVNIPSNQGGPRSVAVVAPGAVTITKAKSAHYHESGATDYAITFQPCADVAGEFGHVTTLDPSLAADLGSFDQGCNTYSPNPGLTVTQCYTRDVAVKLAAGAPIGTAGGISGSLGLDVSLWDRRIAPHIFANPARYSAGNGGFDTFHIVPASDYFAEPARSAIASRVGRHDGAVQRSIAPIGGTHASDIPMTAQGNWFNPSAPTFPESVHLALVPDNVDPTRLVFSIGLSQPGWPSGVYSFVPTGQGLVDRPFQDILADGQIYCFQLPGSRIALLQLTSQTALTLEGRTGVSSCAAAAPFAFGVGAFHYQR